MDWSSSMLCKSDVAYDDDQVESLSSSSMSVDDSLEAESLSRNEV